MSRTIRLALLAGCFFSVGCRDAPAPRVRDALPAESVATPSTAAVAASNETETPSTPDLSIPRLPPKPLVWSDDWKSPAAASTARRAAEQLMSMADQLKAFEEYTEAEQYYRRAMEADPAWAYPAYQLACNYELSGRHERAAEMYAQALELGFDDFPTALADDELGQIRDRPDFPATLAAIRERYIAASDERVGQPIAVRAQGERTAAGRPLMLLLHGYGDSNLSYLDQAEQWAARGFIAVAVPGSVPARSGHFQWDLDSTDPTHQDLQAIIASPLLSGLVDRERVFLLGFSQGALHALLLTAAHPDLYAGVVALSPGGSLAESLVSPSLDPAQRAARCLFIHGTEEPYGPVVRLWSAACRRAGWKFDSRTHPGGHHFPDDWDQQLPGIASFLLE